ncbi:MAG: amidohydrolase [Ruminococcaceae bacterium]|jgi:5-methylthioadenosine/S-adenosylhomocysteine deaminase|nr:amidohydrolase [Oscillospiraceae bacterium]
MLFKNISVLDENFSIKKNMFVGTENEKITYISSEKPEKDFGEEYDGSGKLLMSGLYNAHSHAAMSLLRGWGEDLALSDWLTTKIFPFEDKLMPEDIYNGTMLSIAEMIRFGTVSFTDMYFIPEMEAKAVLESGIKCNFSSGTTSFDDTPYKQLPRYLENERMLNEYSDKSGRFIFDIGVHAEYTNKEATIRALAEHAKEHGANIQVHVSETKKEHDECRARYGRTPAAFLNECGVFDNPATAAHCVWATDSDLEIFKEKGVTVASCPVSNLKLGSGVARVDAMLKKGVNVALGTDGSASNNNLNMFKDLFLLPLLQKGVNNDPMLLPVEECLKIATLNGALSQGRKDCGLVKEGYRADIIILDLNTEHTVPVHNEKANLLYASEGADVVLTMVDGKVLYKNGEYLTLDIEKVKFNAEKSAYRIAGEF